MNTVEIPTTDPQEILDQMSHLVGLDERRRFFERRPDLATVSLVEQACSEVVRQAKIDAERAIELAGSARYLADLVDDDSSRALAARAGANAHHFSGDYEAAQELYSEALGLFERIGESVAAAITRSSALHNLAYLGDYEQVFAWERAARATFEKVDDRLRLAILDHNYGNVLHRQARWQEALERYDAAHEELARLGRAEEAAVCLNNVAACYVDLHHPEAALEIYRRNRAYCREQGLARLVMVVDYHMAYLSYLRAEYTEAIQRFLVARRQAEETGDQVQQALCELDLSEIHLELEMVDEAADLAQSAFDRFDRLKMPYEAAKALTNQAAATSRRGDVDPALALLGRARKSFVREQNLLWPALIDFYQAVALIRAHRYEEAAGHAVEALGVFDRSGLDSRAVMCELALANLELGRFRFEEALSACHRSLERLRSLRSPALEQRAYRMLGEVEEARGNKAAALDAYRRCDYWLESLRTQLRGDDLKIAFFEDKQSIYGGLVCLTLENREDPHCFETAFGYIEKAKSRSLADLLSFRSHALPARSSDGGELALEVRRLREQLNWLYHKMELRLMSGEEGAAEEAERIRQRIVEEEDELLRVQRELEISDLELSSIQTASAVDLPTFRAGLAHDMTLLSYFIARGEIFACVVDSESLELRRVSSEKTTRELHRLLRFQLSRALQSRQRPKVEALIERATGTHLRRLYRELVAPIRPLLRRRQLLIAPHRFLHYLPFHALLDEDDRPLVESFPITVTPSASVHHLGTRKHAVAGRDSLVMGVADERAPHILEEARAVAESLEGARLLEGDQ
ncbi:MAG: CHAT domain-containing protein, partial [Holophagales bacterium]|nr:CHAT domain-containing protein [Holophagales bacterium]